GQVAGDGLGVTAGLAGQTGHGGLATALAATAAEDLLGVGVLPDDLVEDVGDLLAQRARIDAVLGVVGDLLGPAAVGLVDGPSHGGGDGVGVHVDLAGDVARG